MSFFADAIKKMTGVDASAGDAAESAAKALLGEMPAVSDALMDDGLYAWQAANRVRVLARAADKLGGKSVSTLRPDFAMPAMAAAGNAGDPETQDAWAGLLVGVASGTAHASPAFCDTLSRLSDDDLRFFLSFARDSKQPGGYIQRKIPVSQNADDARRVERLMAIGVLVPNSPGWSMHRDDEHTGGVRPADDVPLHRRGEHGPDMFRVSAYGVQLLEAMGA